jgi:hypothetical protein
MKGDSLPEQDHISRYCSAIHCTENGKVTGTAFQLRQRDDYLSVNWLEFLRLNHRQEEIGVIREILRSKLTLGSKAKIAILNIGEIIKYVRSNSLDSRKLSILHEPENNDPSHSGIYGYGYDDQLIADLIAETIQEIHPARESE